MRRGNVAVLVGTVVTAVATGLGFVLPVVVPLLTGNPDDGRPFKTLRVTGGAIGGFVAGVLTPDRTGISKGVKAGTYGSVLLLGGFLAFNLFRSVTLATDPPFLSSIVLPFVLFFPIFGANMVGGLVTGYLGEKTRGELTSPAA